MWGHARVRVACCCHNFILNNFLLFIFIIVIFAENVSFTRKLRRHLLALMALTALMATKYGYQRNPRNVGMIFNTIRDFNYYYYITKTRRSEVTAHSSTSSCAYPHINMRTYVVGVFVQARII